jgi:arsenical resistance operon trans-acting repressor ArsD
MLVTVLRRQPKAIIGMCGIRPDREYERLEEALDWLETTGVLVERFDANTAPAELTNRPVVEALLTRDGARSLPIILFDDDFVSRGVVPTRSQLARLVGSHRAAEKGILPDAVFHH